MGHPTSHTPWVTPPLSGPCGDVFTAWEACVDHARDNNKDFVEACGQPTLALKACTDAHPEYYGALGDDDGEGEEASATTAKAA